MNTLPIDTTTLEISTWAINALLRSEYGHVAFENEDSQRIVEAACTLELKYAEIFEEYPMSDFEGALKFAWDIHQRAWGLHLSSSVFNTYEECFDHLLKDVLLDLEQDIWEACSEGVTLIH